VISAVCIVAIPPGEGRYIKERSVFYITAFFSVFAYGWLLFILTVSSPNIVTPLEGVLTLAFFGVLIGLAYIADVGHLSAFGDACGSLLCARASTPVGPAKVRQVQTIGTMGGGKEATKLSRAYYRIHATRAATGAAQMEVREERRINLLQSAVRKSVRGGGGMGVFEIASSQLSVNVTERWAEVQVCRHGNTLPPASVSYQCTSADNVIGASGLLSFGPSQSVATIRLEVLEEDRQKVGEGAVFELCISEPSAGNELGSLHTCAVRVVSESSPGKFQFESDYISVSEASRRATLTVRRIDGAKGVVSCLVSTQDGKAVAPADYLPLKNHKLEFGDGVLERSVSVAIVNDNQYEGNEDFTVILSDAEGGAVFADECDGAPERAIATVMIINDEDEDVSADCNKMCVALGLNADLLVLIANEWSHQFDEAVRFEGEWVASAILMYTLALPWRLIFAFAPPPRLGGGWVCFCIVLIMIGVLTAIIGDLAAHLGCCLGIAPSITAITFVALGTSLPDTFASMKAAIDEPHADSSIGNITGSNSVNVFLGLGLPWAVAAIYWSVRGRADETLGGAWHARYGSESWYVSGMPVAFAVPAADLGFSVAVFSMCAVLTLGVLILRRATLGFELGGSQPWAKASAVLLVCLWLVYIGASIWYTTTQG